MNLPGMLSIKDVVYHTVNQNLYTQIIRFSPTNGKYGENRYLVVEISGTFITQKDMNTLKEVVSYTSNDLHIYPLIKESDVIDFEQRVERAQRGTSRIQASYIRTVLNDTDIPIQFGKPCLDILQSNFKQVSDAKGGIYESEETYLEWVFDGAHQALADSQLTRQAHQTQKKPDVFQDGLAMAVAAATAKADREAAEAKAFYAANEDYGLF